MLLTPQVHSDIFFFLGKIRLVQIIPKFSHADNETIKSQSPEYLCKWIFFFAKTFSCQCMSVHLESQPSTSVLPAQQDGVNVSVLMGSKFSKLSSLAFFFSFSHFLSV